MSFKPQLKCTLIVELFKPVKMSHECHVKLREGDETEQRT